MPEDIDDEFARRLREVTASVAGLDEEEALQLLEIRLKQVQINGQARHRLSLARARGTLALALGNRAEPDMIASLETMVSTIEESGPPEAVSWDSQSVDPDSPAYDPELAANQAELLECHHQNAVAILRLIAQISVSGDEPELVATLERFLDHDLDAISELEAR
ncbi:hypothetical protein Back2_12820 [Nocardioides baekrokdamisoli]|uniref:Uncharacterized protein n=1 Tax=Nocardioides baekrokdamisoli TaxID=1804624 RepID=A0A3G9ILV5_9ACTN|nr:hypothetical protein [Nocardioides baekrokdamisoli]BBH16995.1 hypothetical protein Back2_12820 [Nocardioides baekrokdamisoli]